MTTDVSISPGDGRSRPAFDFVGESLPAVGGRLRERGRLNLFGGCHREHHSAQQQRQPVAICARLQSAYRIGRGVALAVELAGCEPPRAATRTAQPRAAAAITAATRVLRVPGPRRAVWVVWPVHRSQL